MKKHTRLGLVSFFIPFVFLFQNCEHNEEAHLHAPTTRLESLDVHTLHIPIPDDHTRSASSTQKPTQHNNIAVIDLYNSVIKDSEGEQYCPGYDFFYSLQHILNTAQLCSTTLSEDTVCSTEYTLPKALLITKAGTQIALGSRDDSCKQVDLCGSNQEDFNVLIEMFLEIKDSFKCASI